MPRATALLALAACSFWCAGAARPVEKPAAPHAEPAAVSDRDLSLYPGSVFEAPVPPVVHVRATDPGENDRLPRAFAGAPPRIPHGIADFVPITRDSNACADCHAPDSGGPEYPASHRTDWRRGATQPGENLVGARYNCTTCHVPLTDAPLLRANTFASPGAPTEKPPS